METLPLWNDKPGATKTFPLTYLKFLRFLDPFFQGMGQHFHFRYTIVYAKKLDTFSVSTAANQKYYFSLQNEVYHNWEYQYDTQEDKVIMYMFTGRENPQSKMFQVVDIK